MLVTLSCVELFTTPWAVAHQVPLSIEFSRQEYWSGLLLLMGAQLILHRKINIWMKSEKQHHSTAS